MHTNEHGDEIGLVHGGVEYPACCDREWFEQHTDVPTEILDAHFGLEDCHAKRKAEYPPIEDQLDTIFHSGLDAWRAEIQAVKDRHPKP